MYSQTVHAVHHYRRESPVQSVYNTMRLLWTYNE